MRTDAFPVASPEAFRREFRGAVATIEAALSLSRGGIPTLLTDDHHTFTWWTMMRKGYVAMPDVFTIVSSQTTIEQALFRVGRLFGLSPDAFIRLLEFTPNPNPAYNSWPTINIWFLGHNRYDIASNWIIALSEDEKTRLRDAYAAHPESDVARPSVILLLGMTQEFLREPVHGRYCIFGSNQNFRLMFDMDTIDVDQMGRGQCRSTTQAFAPS
jgi:hypothetical protein